MRLFGALLTNYDTLPLPQLSFSIKGVMGTYLIELL